jgi:electron transfer flavoprotein beta subunit
MIAVCMKWIDHRPDVDRLTGEVHTDSRTSGASDADQAALEWGLRTGDAWRADVVAITAGPAAAEAMLREALSVGAARAIRVELAGHASSDVVAAALFEALPAGVDLVLCGAWSVDRGTGSVPAYLAARLEAAQALGLITVSFDASAIGVVDAERRLDGGRRERLRARVPAVLSVEGGGARLRRAPLASVLDARTAPIDVVVPTAGGVPGRVHAPAIRTAPFRPRARALPAPSAALSARQRILALTGALVDRDPPRLVRLDPPAAADELLAQLEAWGYR